MVLIFCDSFDHYSTTELADKWDSINFTPTISASAGRNGDGMEATSSEYVQKDFDDGTSWVFGFNLKFSTTSTGNTTFIQLLDGTTVTFSLFRDGSRDRLGFTNGTTSFYTTGVVPDDDNWRFYEAKVAFVLGKVEVEIRLDGTTVLNRSVPKNSSGTSVFNRVRLGTPAGSGPTHHIDDFYLVDTSGLTNNDFLGEVIIEATFPDGAGNSSDMSPTGAGTNHEATDEDPPDGDTTYVSSSTLNDKDTHTTDNLATSSISSVVAVQTNLYARKESTSSRELSDVIRSGGTDYNGSLSHALTTSYDYYSTPHDTNPDTGSAFTETNFNSGEFGYEIVV